MKYLIFMLMLFSLSIIFLNHPMSMGLILLMQTFMISIIINMMNYNFWFSYILFLIMIGGMLILFIYMTSIASNEQFKLSYMLMFLFLCSMFLIIMLMLLDNSFFNINFINNETLLMNFNLNFKFSMNKMFMYPNMNLFYLTIIYLLITLIAVVKISNMKMGPLRQMN